MVSASLEGGRCQGLTLAAVPGEETLTGHELGAGWPLPPTLVAQGCPGVGVSSLCSPDSHL